MKSEYFGAILLAALAASSFCGPVFAHHSFAVYDRSKVVTLQGDVKIFQWTNPHCVIWFVVKPEGGEPQEWAVETTSPGVLTRTGWTRNSLKPGDHVTVELNPLRDESHGGRMLSVTLPTGQKLTTTLTPQEQSESDAKPGSK